jgi:hypothetical protein
MMKKIQEEIKQSTIGKLWQMLPPRQKKKLILVTTVIIMSAAINVGGIASIMPFMQVLANPDTVTENPALRYMYLLMGSPEIHLFLIIIGIGVLILLVLSNLFMALSVYIQQKFAKTVTYRFTARLRPQVLITWSTRTAARFWPPKID